MKKITLITTMMLFASILSAQQKLTIIEQDYELARKEAKQQNKLLIIDFYTTWCIPCKLLDKKIFKDKSMADKICGNFVVLKYDAEKDSIHNLSLKHHISSYPTNIIMTDDGKVISKLYGYGRADSLTVVYENFLNEGLSLNKEGRYLRGISQEIDANMYPAFYQKYVRRIADIKKDDIGNFWQKNTDFTSELSFTILCYFGEASDTVINFLTNNKSIYEERYGKRDVNKLFNTIVYKKFDKAILYKSETYYAEALEFATKQLSEKDATQFNSIYRLEMDIAMGNWNSAINNVSDQYNKHKIEGGGVNNFCWNVFEKCNDKSINDRSLKLMEMLVKTEPSYANLDTYSRLLDKSGNKPDAIKVMQRAIAKGKKDGADTQDSEDVLKKFQRK